MYYLYIFYTIILPILSFKKESIKFCKNCKYYILTDNDKLSKCAFFPKKEGLINYLVEGIDEKQYFFCNTARSIESMCGIGGKHYKKI